MSRGVCELTTHLSISVLTAEAERGKQIVNIIISELIKKKVFCRGRVLILRPKTKIELNQSRVPYKRSDSVKTN